MLAEYFAATAGDWRSTKLYHTKPMISGTSARPVEPTGGETGEVPSVAGRRPTRPSRRMPQHRRRVVDDWALMMRTAKTPPALEVAPVSWTPDLLSFRSPRWQRSTHLMRQSFAGK
jgi:hypothetical protein